MEQSDPILQLFSLTNLDATMIGVGTVFIFALYAALKSALLTPLMRHVEEREGVTAGALYTADQMRQKTQALQGRYDEGMLQARVAANRERAEVVAKAKSEAAATITQAEGEAARELQSGRAAIGRAIEQANQGAEAEALALADTLSAKVDSQLVLH